MFDKVKPEPLTKRVHHPFLAGEFKTKDRPIAEAQVQCQRTGSALVAYYADWTDEVNDKARSKPLTTLPEVDIETETSTPDHDSFCFTIATSLPLRIDPTQPRHHMRPLELTIGLVTVLSHSPATLLACLSGVIV